MRNMRVSVIRIDNITHLFFTSFEQYFYLPANTIKEPLHPLPPSPLQLELFK